MNEQWQLSGTAPELYQRHLVPAMTAIWAADLVDRAAVRPGEQMLDLACGTGTVARVAAERAGSTGQITALDINPGMLAVARSLPPVKGAPIEWLEGSALALPFPDATYDLVLCQLGLQFFSDRSGALREIGRVLVARGRVGLSVFGPIEHNPATHALANALDRHLGPGKSVIKRSEHSLADTQTLRSLVSRGGFRDVTIATATKLIRFRSVSDYVRIQLAATPLATLIAEHPRARRQSVTRALVDDVGAALQQCGGGDGLVFPQEVHVVVASK